MTKSGKLGQFYFLSNPLVSWAMSALMKTLLSSRSTIYRTGMTADWVHLPYEFLLKFQMALLTR